MNIFHDGVHLDLSIFNQFERMNLGRNKFRKHVFNPTYLTTGFIFQRIMDCRIVNLMRGHYGISKTFSYMLFHLLSNYIIKFKINHPGH